MERTIPYILSHPDVTDAAFAVHMFMPESDLGYEVTRMPLNTDGSSLLLAESHRCFDCT